MLQACELAIDPSASAKLKTNIRIIYALRMQANLMRQAETR
jgi:hypothetical protein